MKPIDSARVFEEFAAAHGVVLRLSTPRAGVGQMLAFYRAVTPEDCGGPGGDMLLFEWGTYDWGAGPHSELGITRQFSEEAFEDDDALSQLRLVFHGEPTQERALLGAGNRWCSGPEELESFRDFVFSSPLFAVLADEAAMSVELIHARV